MTSQSSGGEPPMRQPGISRTLQRSVQISIPQAVESCKVEITAILKDTVWPRRSTDTARDLKQTIENAQNLNSIPNDENLIRAEHRASLEQFIRIMEGVRGRLSKASNKYGAKERSFGNRTKYLFTYLDRDQCTEILESCHNEMKTALGSLPDGWNMEDEEAGGVGDGELEGTRTLGIQPAAVHVGDVLLAVSADNTSNPQIAPQPPGSQSAATVPSNNQNQQPAVLDEQPQANPRRREWLGTLKTAFDVVEGVSGMIPVVGTYVGSAAKVGATLVEMVQGMGSNEEAAKDLESRALELSNILKHFNDESVEKRKDDLTKYINDLQRELQSVQREVERLDSSGVFKKVFASSDRAETLKGYQETIRTALEQIQLLATLNTSSLVSELYDKEATKEQRRLLKVLGDANYGARGDAIEDVICLEGTRVQILSRIDEWIRDAATSERALWLHGMAGRGKSTIASTVAHRWTDRAACAIFHFRRGQNTLDKRLVCALARQLCSNGLVPELRESILKSVEENEDIVQDRLQGQFKALLVDPLARFRRNPVPILLIVDALDECEDVNYAVRFVELIDQNSSRFPSNVKFLLTSRPEAQLIRALEPRQWHAENLDTTADVAEDVERYLRVGFSKVRPVGQAPGKWPRSEDVAALVERSQGLFQWAYTAMEYIKRGSAEERLKWLLTSPETYAGLDSLYLQIFTQALNKAKESPVGEQPLLYMLSALVTAPHPISLDIFAYLSADLPSFQGKHHDTIVQLLRSEILVNLGSVIHVPDSSGDSIRLIHTSVRDLLVNGERCGGEPYSVDVVSSHRYLAQKCLQRMRRDLKHNICHLSDLSKANSDTDIQERVKLYVPKGLQYCCRSWAIHLMAGETGPPLGGQQILAEIGSFSEEKVLGWLEVMSLVGETRESLKIARRMHSWIQECPHAVDPLLTALWSDMHRFIAIFYEPIAFGTLHIYASALPLSPVNTSLWKHNRNCASTRMLNGLRDTIWPSSIWSRQTSSAIRFIAFSPNGELLASGPDYNRIQWWDAESGAPVGEPLRGQDDWITAVAFSPNGKLLASGSGDKTIQLCDAESGAPVGEPLRGHDDSISAVAFSPDGKLLASGSNDKTIRLWDAESGAPVGEPLRGHDGPINTVAFSPNGKLLASGSGDTTIRLWDAESGAPVGEPLRGHDGHVNTVAFSPNGKLLASGSHDTTIQLWDAESGALVGEPLRGHDDWIHAVAFSPNGKLLASGSGDKTIRLWDAGSGAPVGEPLRGHDGWVTAVAFSPNGKLLASGSHDKTIQLWDAESAAHVGERLGGHDGPVNAVTFSPNGKLFASGSHDKTIQLWDAESGAPVGEPLRGHDDWVTAVAFSPNGKLLASGSLDQTIQLWDAESGAPVGEPLRGHDSCISTVAFSPNGKLFASGSHDKTIQLWDAESGAPVGEPLRGHDDSITAVAFSPNGKLLASGSGDTTIQLWDAESGAPVGEPLRGHDNWVSAVAFSPNGKLLASGSHDATIQLWDAESGAHVGLRGHNGCISTVAFSPNGKLLASGSWDNTIQLWDAESGAPFGEPLRGHDGWINAVAFSPNGKLLASGSEDKTVQLWDAESGAPVGAALRGHDDSISAVAFSPNGKLFASGSGDTTIRLWDAESGAPVGEPLRGHDGWVTAVAFSPNGKLLASGSGDITIRLWDVESGAPVGEPLMGHDRWISAVAFSPNGKLLASGSRDKTIRLWDAGSGAPVGEPLRGHDGLISAVAFSPNGKLLASGSDDTTIRLWDAESGAPVGEPLRGHDQSFDAEILSPSTACFTLLLQHFSASDSSNLLSHPIFSYLNTSPILSHDTYSTPSPSSGQHSLGFQGQWVTFQSNKFLWLPHKYWRDSSSIILLSHGTLAMTSGRFVYFFDLSHALNLSHPE